MTGESINKSKIADSQQALLDNNHQKSIAVLMCTYNGEAHLGEQLESILQQSFRHIDIWVSDDGSTDKTLKILETYKAKWPLGNFNILNGPQRGFATNFLSLICNDKIQADYYAYSDQDDIWEIDKLSRALHAISHPTKMPSLYCSRTHIIAECGKSMRLRSPRFQRKPSFANALIQSLAGGNTMVLNQAAMGILRKAGMQEIVSHDWWTYMLVSGAGGKVFYDLVPSVRYRQHSENLIGFNTGYMPRLKRLGMLLRGGFSDWNALHISSLNNVRKLLQPSNQEILDNFAVACKAGLIKRLLMLKKSGVYRQTTKDNVALCIAALLNKI